LPAVGSARFGAESWSAAETDVLEQRSFTPIDEDDLRCLVRLALDDLESLYRRKPRIREICEGRLLCLALCQGGALHYIDRVTGVKDLDVWAFFERDGTKQFPYRRRGVVDFGSPKFGRTPGYPHFVGRSVDVLGRSISVRDGEAPPYSVLRYIREGSTATARHLAKKAVVLLYPGEYFAQILWRGPSAR
jgi:hypothetical protein